MNESTLLEEPMAKKAGRPPNPEKGLPIRIHPDVHKKAKRVADHLGLTLSDYLSNLVRPDVNRDYGAMLKELDAEDAGEPRSPKKRK